MFAARRLTPSAAFLLQLKVTQANGQSESVLSKARYLASNSGGSWFNSAFSYTNVRAL